MIEKSLSAIVLIPAKGHSNRLPGKNLSILDGKTLIEHSIDYAKKSSIVKSIYISSESETIQKLAIKNSVKFIQRPSELLGEAEVSDIYFDFCQSIDISSYDYLIGLQPDHPDRKNKLDDIIQYAFIKKYMDLFTVNKDGSRNGSVRIIDIKFLIQGKFSRRVGSVSDFCTNIETPEQLEKVRNNYKK